MSETNEKLLKAALDFAKAFEGMVSGLKQEIESAQSGTAPSGASASPVGTGGTPTPQATTPPSGTTPPVTPSTVTPRSGTTPTATTPVATAPVSKTTDRAPGKIKPDKVREFLAGIDFSEGSDAAIGATADALKDMMDQLTEDGAIKHLPNRRALAAAMRKENGVETDEFWFEMLQNNAGRGFTAGDGTIYTATTLPEEARKKSAHDEAEDLAETNAGADHDKVHESVHVMSAPGGQTSIMAQYGEPLNEGFTEYFAIQMCGKLGVPTVKAYPEEVAFVTKLATAYGESKAYTAYMKNGGFDPLLDDLIATWKSKDTVLLAARGTARFAVPKLPDKVTVNEDAARKKMVDYVKALKNNTVLWNALL